MTDGRIRAFAFPHALDAINGIVTFDATAVRLDGLRARARRRQRAVRRPPRACAAWRSTDYDVTLTGHDLRLRYPEGMRSLVDADADGAGPGRRAGAGGIGAGPLGGLDTRPFDGTANLFGVDGATAAAPTGGAGGGARGADGCRCATTCGSWRRPRSASRTTWRGSSRAPTCNVRGTYDRPLVFGRADIERGEVHVRGPALRGVARQPRLHQPRADPAVLRHRGRDARARARARPTASRCAWPARPSACSPSSPPTRRCRRPTCCRCCSPTRRRPATSRWRRCARPTSASRSCCRRARRARSPARCRPRSARSCRRPSASTRSRSRRCSSIPTSSRRGSA